MDIQSFKVLARDELAFLEEEGFAVREHTHTMAFASVSVEIWVTFDERAYELSAELSPATGEHAGKRFPIQFVLAAVSPEDALTYRDYAATTAEGVRNGLQFLASLIQRCLPHLHNASTFADAERIQNAEMDAYWSDLDRRALQSRASEAWDRQDYQTVIDEFEKLGDALTIADRRKLFLAKRAIQTASR